MAFVSVLKSGCGVRAGGFEAEPNRHHPYVSYTCPWAHRSLIYRNILKLHKSISVSVLHPVDIVEGWEFSEFSGATADEGNGAKYLRASIRRSIRQVPARFRCCGTR